MACIGMDELHSEFQENYVSGVSASTDTSTVLKGHGNVDSGCRKMPADGASSVPGGITVGGEVTNEHAVPACPSTVQV